MGIGSSRERYGPRPGRRASPARYGRYGQRRRRRGLFGKVEPTFSTSGVAPNKYHYPRHQPRRAPPYGPYMLPYAPVYPSYLPISYNNYGISPYSFPGQNYFTPQQQMQPMVMPQQVPPAMFSPYMSSPYSMGVPFSTPYMPEQLQAQHYYNNLGFSAPASAGIPVSSGPYSSPYPVTRIKLSTDWTGGGKISPGFLGPPI